MERVRYVVMLCYIELCYIELCYVLLSYAIVCYTVVCCDWLRVLTIYLIHMCTLRHATLP
jgi:hypothetical protein